MSDKDLQYFFMALPADIQTSFKSYCTKYCSAFRDFINQTMVTHAQYLSRVVKTANRAVRDNEALGGNENENENEEDNEGNENEEDNETENESGNENEEAGPEADPAGLETDQEADSDDV